MLDDKAFIFAQINYLAELVEDAEVDFALAFLAVLAAFLVDFLVVLAAFLVSLAAFLVDFLVVLAAFLVSLAAFLVAFLATFLAAFLVLFLADFLAASLLDDEASDELLFDDSDEPEAFDDSDELVFFDDSDELVFFDDSDELETFDDSDELVFFDEVAELTELVFFDEDSAAVLLLLTSVLFSVAARTGLTPVASNAAATVALPRFFIKRLFFIIRFLSLYRYQNNFLLAINYTQLLKDVKPKNEEN